jgi:hypothetical protein
MPLPDKAVKGFHPGQKSYKRFDGGRLGLYLEARSSGSKLWRVQFRRDGKQSLKSLGPIPC